MEERLLTEDDYREALKRFMEIIENDLINECLDEFLKLMRQLETYEYENC